MRLKRDREREWGWKRKKTEWVRGRERESERVQKGRTMAGTTNVVGRRRRLAVVTISRAAVEPGTTTDVVKPIRI